MNSTILEPTEVKSSASLPPKSDLPFDAIKAARELGLEFSKTATNYDREGFFSKENYMKAHENGFALITVPKEYGGYGVDILTFSLAMEELGRHCAGTAIAMSMHLSLMGMVSRVMTKAQRDAFYSRVKSEKICLGGGGSEEHSGGTYDAMATRARKVEGGYIINGRKKFASGCLAADYLFHFVRTSEAEMITNFGISGFLIPRKSPGVEIIESWDTMGMRASGSHEIVLTEVFVPESCLVGQHNRGFVKGIPYFYYFLLGQLSVYLGIAGASLEVAVTTLKKRYGKEDGKVKVPGEIETILGEAKTKLEAARTMVFDLSRFFSDPVNAERGYDIDGLARGSMAKYFATVTAVEVVDKAMLIVGATAYFKGHPLERHYRDVRAGAFHPPRNFPTALHIAAQHAIKHGR